MSQENVETVRRAWQAPDVESLFRFYDQAIIWESHYGPISGAYHGHEGVRKFVTRVDIFETKAEALEAAGPSERGAHVDAS